MKNMFMLGAALLCCMGADAQPNNYAVPSAMTNARDSRLANSVPQPRVRNASFIPCPGATGSVTVGGTSPTFTCGALTFDNFELLNPAGGAVGVVDILGAQYDSTTGAVDVQLIPHLLANQDEQLMFQVWGGVVQFLMSVGGQNATVTERACANPIPTSGPLAFLCTDSTGTMVVLPLGQITVASNTPSQPVFSAPFSTTSPVYIFKDIQAGAGGALSEFTQGFEPPATATLVIDPGSGSPGTSLTVTGSGFAPSETIDIYVTSPGHTVTADGSGAFMFTTRERQAPYGAMTLYAVGQTSGTTGHFLFQVTPRLVLNPNTGALGSTTTVQGLGFGAGETVKVYWNNPRQFLGAATADNRGSFLDGSALTITIPVGAPLGANAVFGVGQTTNATGKGWIMVQ